MGQYISHRRYRDQCAFKGALNNANDHRFEEVEIIERASEIA
jgi:hypothetical protein